MSVCFTITSNFAVTTARVSVNNIRGMFFLRESLYPNKKLRLHGGWKITLSLKNFKLLSLELTKRVLSCNDFFPIKGGMQINFFLKACRTIPFFKKTLSKYFLLIKMSVVFKFVNFLMKNLKVWWKFDCAAWQVAFIWLWDEAFKVATDSAKFVCSKLKSWICYCPYLF